MEEQIKSGKKCKICSIWGIAVLASAVLLTAAFMISHPVISSEQKDSILTVKGCSDMSVHGDVLCFELTLLCPMKRGENSDMALEKLNKAENLCRKTLADRELPASCALSGPDSLRTTAGNKMNQAESWLLERKMVFNLPPTPKSRVMAGIICGELSDKGYLFEAGETKYLLYNAARAENELLHYAAIDAVERAADIAGASGAVPGKLRSAGETVFKVEEERSTPGMFKLSLEKTFYFTIKK